MTSLVPELVVIVRYVASLQCDGERLRKSHFHKQGKREDVRLASSFASELSLHGPFSVALSRVLAEAGRGFVALSRDQIMVSISCLELAISAEAMLRMAPVLDVMSLVTFARGVW